MPGHLDEHAHEHEHEHEHEAPEGGRESVTEDGGFYLELSGILILDVLGELPGLCYLKHPYAKVKERFAKANDLKDDARDLRTRAVDLETSLGEMQVHVSDKDTSRNLCSDLRKLIGELEKVRDKSKVMSVARYGSLKEDMDKNVTTFEILNRRYISLQTRSEMQGVRDDIRSVYGEVEGVREAVEEIKKAQAHQISVQNNWMTRIEERFRNIDWSVGGQGSSDDFASLSRMEEGTAGLDNDLDN